MRLLFLDDIRSAPPGWDTVRSYNQFVDYIQVVGTPDVISFDHDLGFEHYPLGEQNPTATIPYESYKEKTGYHAARWCLENDKLPKIVIVHSFNIVGSRNIAELLKDHCKVYIRAYQLPYPAITII